METYTDAALLPRGLTLCKVEDGPFRHKGNSWWKEHIFFKGALWKVIGIADNWWYLVTSCPLSHLLPLVSLQGKYYHFLHLIKQKTETQRWSDFPKRQKQNLNAGLFTPDSTLVFPYLLWWNSGKKEFVKFWSRVVFPRLGGTLKLPGNICKTWCWVPTLELLFWLVLGTIWTRGFIFKSLQVIVKFNQNWEHLQGNYFKWQIPRAPVLLS